MFLYDESCSCWIWCYKCFSSQDVLSTCYFVYHDFVLGNYVYLDELDLIEENYSQIKKNKYLILNVYDYDI